MGLKQTLHSFGIMTNMRKTTFAAAVLALSTTLSLADVLIYKGSETARIIGGGRETKVTASTYFVRDLATDESKLIGAMVLNGSKVFVISSPQGLLYSTAAGAGGKTYTVMTRYDEKVNPPQNLLGFGIGLNSPLEVRPRIYVSAPRTTTNKGLSIASIANDPNVTVTDSTVTLTYSTAQTKAANAACNTISTIIENLRQQYLAKGYKEVIETR